MKIFLKWIFKATISGIIAIIFLSIFSLFYYNFGIRRTNESGATDYVWENRFFSLGYEGFAWGINDTEGLNNVWPKQEQIDILLMGSSQMEARNVAQNKNTGYLLNELCTANEVDLYTYNIGVEGHTIYALANNIHNALDKYRPTKYVIAETRTVELEVDTMQAVLSDTLERSPAYDSGMLYYLQKIPYLRLVHKQLNNVRSQHSDLDNSKEKSKQTIDDEYKTVLDKFLGKMSEEAQVQGCTLIIFYLPTIQIRGDGNLTATTDEQFMEVFQSICAEKEIVLVDMTNDFIKEYTDNSRLPYGFSNTKIGTGHLNAVGHELIADRLYNVVTENEK